MNTPRGPGQRTLLWLSIPVLLAFGCGSLASTDASTGTVCPADGCFSDAAVETKNPTPEAGSPEADSGENPNLLCGIGCNPDKEESCLDQDAAVDASTVDASTVDALTVDADAGSVPSDAGFASDGKTDADVGGGNMGSFGPSVPSGDEDAGNKTGPYSACQVSWEGTSVKAKCTASGGGKVHDPCSRSSDCSATLTCVGTLAIAQCLRYCCKDDCESGFYCSDEIARDFLADHPSASPSELRKVPVCVAAKQCDPIDSEQGPNKCENGLSCAIVRSDGTTGCVALPKDAAKDGASCKAMPCAAGYLCAKSTNTCMKLCHVASTNNECEGGVCQGGSTNLPAGLGICLGNYDK